MRIINTESRLETNLLLVHVVLVCAIAQAMRRRLVKTDTRIQSQPSGARLVMHEVALEYVICK
jgi:hypothetical protein